MGNLSKCHALLKKGDFRNPPGAKIKSPPPSRAFDLRAGRSSKISFFRRARHLLRFPIQGTGPPAVGRGERPANFAAQCADAGCVGSRRDRRGTTRLPTGRRVTENLKVPDAGMLMIVALDRLVAAAFAPGERHSGYRSCRDEERRNAARPRAGAWPPERRRLSRRRGSCSLKSAQPPILALHRGRVVGKRFPAGRTFLRRERVVFATAERQGPAREPRVGTPRTGWRRPSRSNAIASMASGRLAASPIDPIRRGAKRGYAVVLVARPVDECPAVEHNFEVFAGGRVADGRRSRPRVC